MSSFPYPEHNQRISATATPSAKSNRNVIDERMNEYYRQQKSHAITSAHKHGGLKINRTDNDYVIDHFADVDPFAAAPKAAASATAKTMDYNNKSVYESIDLNIQNYSRADLLHLFGFEPGIQLTEENIKQAKKILLKTHPDKSGIDAKYFLFFQQAFQKIVDIHSFQNKSKVATSADWAADYKTLIGEPAVETSASFAGGGSGGSLGGGLGGGLGGSLGGNSGGPDTSMYGLTSVSARGAGAFNDAKRPGIASPSAAASASEPAEAKKHLLDQKRKELGKDWNSWFNTQFEQTRIDNPLEKGYGDWLKSDEGIDFAAGSTSLTNREALNASIESRKRNLLAVMPRKDPGDFIGVASGSMFGGGGASAMGSSLMEYDSNFSSTSLFAGANGIHGFTDLRQAYVESVIPVTEDDLAGRPQFRTVDEYRQFRDSTTVKPLSKEEAMRQLYNEKQKESEESSALAFYYAQQAEKAKQKDDWFWSSLKQIGI